MDDERTWLCDNEVIKENLELRTELLPHAYYPDPAAGIARTIASQVGAEVIRTDPVDHSGSIPGMDY